MPREFSTPNPPSALTSPAVFSCPRSEAIPSALDIALAWAKLGVRVFPIVRGEKRPAIDNWPSEATTDPARLREWFAADGYEAGGVMGALADGTCIAAVDLDAKGSVSGAASIDSLGADHDFEFVSDTLSQRTPSGGEHRLVRTRALLGNSASSVAPGVDIRGHRGYIKLYELPPAGAEFPEAPAWLETLCAGIQERDAQADEWLCEPDQPGAIERGQKFLQTTKPAVSGHGGNNHTYATAEVLRDFGLTEETAIDLLLAHFNPRCVPPWDGDELGQIVANAYTYPKRPAGTLGAAPERFESLLGETEAPSAASESAKTKPSKRKRFYSRSELKSFPLPEWTIENLLTKRGVFMIYGPWGAGKSYVVLTILLDAATGRQSFGCAVKRPLRVVYVTGEGVETIRPRVEAWEATHNDGMPAENFIFADEMPLFTNLNALRAWAEELATLKPDIVVFDTASHALAGQDENSTKDVSQFMAQLYSLRDELGCAVGFVHHTGRGDQTHARGSAELEQKSDTILRVIGDSEGGRLEAGGRAEVTMTKQKAAKVWTEKRYFALADVGDNAALVASAAPAANGTARNARETLWRRAREAALLEFHRLSKGPVSTSTLAKEMQARIFSGPGDGTSLSKIRAWLGDTAKNSRDAESQRFYVGLGTRNSQLWEWREATADVENADSFQPPANIIAGPNDGGAS